MERKDINRILEQAGWKATIGAPKHVVDYQRSDPYSRIILYPGSQQRCTEEALNDLMRTSAIGGDRVEVLRRHGL